MVNQKRADRYLPSEEIDADFYPGVRFFFDTRGLFRHPRAEWDYHPVKIRESLDLAPYLVAGAAPAALPDGRPLEFEVPRELRERIVRLDHRKHRGLAAWSTAAFEAARSQV